MPSRLLDRPVWGRFEVRHAIVAALIAAGVFSGLHLAYVERFVDAPAVVRQLCERWDVLEFDRNAMDPEDRLAASEIDTLCKKRKPLAD